MADIATCWRETGNGEAFMKALETKGYFLTRGDRRVFVVVDLHGEVHSLSRQLAGIAKSKELRDRLSVIAYSTSCPISPPRKEWASTLRTERERQAGQEREKSEVEKRLDALKAHQQQRRDAVDKQRIDMLGRHLSERETMRHMQQAANTGVVSARLAKQPKGLLAFLARITGIKMIAEARQKREDARRQEQQKQQAEALQRRHDRELKGMDRHYRALARLEARENRSVETALKREAFQKTLALLRKPPGRRNEAAIRPRRAAQVQQRTGTGDGKAVTPTDDFQNAAKAPVDLTEAFNRRVDQRLARKDRDRELDGPDRGFDRTILLVAADYRFGRMIRRCACTLRISARAAQFFRRRCSQ